MCFIGNIFFILTHINHARINFPHYRHTLYVSEKEAIFVWEAKGQRELKSFWKLTFIRTVSALSRGHFWRPIYAPYWGYQRRNRYGTPNPSKQMKFNKNLKHQFCLYPEKKEEQLLNRVLIYRSLIQDC